MCPRELADVFIDTSEASDEKNQEEEAVVDVDNSEGRHFVAGVVNYDRKEERVLFPSWQNMCVCLSVSRFLVYFPSKKLKLKKSHLR